MSAISFNTMSRVVNTIKANSTELKGVSLEKVKEASCDYNYFFKLIANLFGIEPAKEKFNRLDRQKELFALKLMLKLQQVNKKTNQIKIEIPSYIHDGVHKIELRRINRIEMECIIDGVTQGKIEGTLMGLKKFCIRKKFK